MKDERKVTIIREIEYWKQHKLLPEHYCDYLLALYSKGEDVDSLIENETESDQYLNVVERFQIVLLYLLLPFSFVVIYFTEFHVYLQLVILALLVCYSFWSIFNLKKGKRYLYYSAVIISLFLLMLGSVLVSNYLFNNSMITTILIAINFLVWIFLGRHDKLKYIMVIGVLGVIFVFVYYFLGFNTISL